jgi:hypothetical protein
MKSFIIASFSTGKTGHDDAKWLPREKEYINEFTSEKCNISPKRERAGKVYCALWHACGGTNGCPDRYRSTSPHLFRRIHC